MRAAAARNTLLRALTAIVGRSHVITRPDEVERYARGYRTGAGPCLAVARPASLIEMWRVLNACVAADCAILMQAANTGLTGGSTPTHGCDREVVVVSTLRITGVRVIKDGAQVVCLAGSTLNQLERTLEPFKREPHSVIGSSCIGASVVGGVCNNSGGALVRRGPAYTELALYAQLDARGSLQLVNHLGMDLGNQPEEMLALLDSNAPLDELLTATDRKASDNQYQDYVRDIDAPSPARFNADPRRLFEASGSAGKVAVFAVRLDTFAPDPGTTTFYIGTAKPDDLTQLRRRLLQDLESLPLAAEYLHRDAFDVAQQYGKDAYLAIRFLGVERLGLLDRLKRTIDNVARRLAPTRRNLSDSLLQALASLSPSHLPPRIKQYRDLYEHHLILKVSTDAAVQVEEILTSLHPEHSGFFECTARESWAAFTHRFVTAGAAVRYRAIHHTEVADIVALDFALKRNERNWVETLPSHIEAKVVRKLYYGHFLCHVFHHDYLVRKGCDVVALEHEMCALLDERGAEYPAEHNVGHLYRAKPELARHYRALDPNNLFNPGVGHLSKRRNWT